MLAHRLIWPVPLPKLPHTEPSSGFSAVMRPSAMGLNSLASQVSDSFPSCAATGYCRRFNASSWARSDAESADPEVASVEIEAESAASETESAEAVAESAETTGAGAIVDAPPGW